MRRPFRVVFHALLLVSAPLPTSAEEFLRRSRKNSALTALLFNFQTRSFGNVLIKSFFLIILTIASFFQALSQGTRPHYFRPHHATLADESPFPKAPKRNFLIRFFCFVSTPTLTSPFQRNFSFGTLRFSKPGTFLKVPVTK